MVLSNYAGINVIALTHKIIISCLIDQVFGRKIEEIPTAGVWRLLLAGSTLVHLDALNPGGILSRRIIN